MKNYEFGYYPQGIIRSLEANVTRVTCWINYHSACNLFIKGQFMNSNRFHLLEI